MQDNITYLVLPNLNKMYITFDDNRLHTYFVTCIFVREEITQLQIKRAVTRCIKANQSALNGFLHRGINIRFATVYQDHNFDRIPLYRKDLELNLWENLRGRRP